MDAPELLALSLGLSVVVAALAWAGGRLVERLSADPRLRDRVWAAALILPSLPPLAVGLMLLTPAPVREIAPPPVGPSADFAMPAFEFAAVAPSAGPVIDPTLAAWAVLGVTILLAVVRLAALALRARRLLRLIGQAQVPGPGVTAMVEDAARELAIRPPLVRVSATAPEALLASLGRAQLILPAGLTAPSADPAAARAAITHELSHLKRGDHRALWLEETLLALLAINPLMPTLRARRAAAREEACDALALAGAAPEARRAYARSLIEALRSRAAPQGSGGLPALTFTGAGRTTAMRRLKAVLSPAPAAGRGPRLMAVGLAGLIAALTGAGSLAVAGEREAVIRMSPAPASATAPAPLRDEAPRTVDLGADARTLLNGKPFPEGLPIWAVAAERVDVRTPPAGSGEVDFILPFTGTTPVSVNGRRMPAGFPANGVNGDAVARVDVVGDHVMYTLKPEADVRRSRQQPHAAPIDVSTLQAVEPARSSLTPEQEARYRNATARDYQIMCASGDIGDESFCAGVMFSVLGRAPQNGLCAPTTATSPDATGSDLNTLVDRGRQEVAGMRPDAGERAYEFAQRALKQAYPCQTADKATARSIDAGSPGTTHRPTVVLASSDAPRVTPADALDIARTEPAKVEQDTPAPAATPAPARPAESEFLAARRAEREAARAGWPNERGLRLPGWPRPDRPAPRSPFANERRAADPQNSGVPRI